MPETFLAVRCGEVTPVQAVSADFHGVLCDRDIVKLRAEAREFEKTLSYVEYALLATEVTVRGGTMLSVAAASVPWSFASLACRQVDGVRSCAVTVTLRCVDGDVVVRRADWLSSHPGALWPVSESVCVDEDVCPGGVRWVDAALRGVREELGVLSPVEVVGEPLAVVSTESVNVWVPLETSLSFADVVSAHALASHRDEGTPVLLPDRMRGAR